MSAAPPSPQPAGVAPSWFAALGRLPATVAPGDLGRFAPPPGAVARRSAVLLLFGAPAQTGGAGPEEVRVLLTERAATLRSHAGQVALPGGRIDPDDAGPTGAAVRETVEECGVDPALVRPAGELPALYLPPSGWLVTPVLAWTPQVAAARVVDPGEVARVEQVPVVELIDPASRFLVTHPSGFVGPGFSVRDLFVWGFTAGLLDRVLSLAGWELPWDRQRVLPLPERSWTASSRGRSA
jgi:8-oxo-dGTP pyrophosphatase MutT (NUDIX family)